MHSVTPALVGLTDEQHHFKHLIEATKALDDGNLDDIRQWLNQPVFP